MPVHSGGFKSEQRERRPEMETGSCRPCWELGLYSHIWRPFHDSEGKTREPSLCALQALCQSPRRENIVKKENTFNWLCDLRKIWRFFKPLSSPLENGDNNAPYLGINKSMKGVNPCKVGPHRRAQQTSNIIIPGLYLTYYIKLPASLFIYVFIYLLMNHWIHFQPSSRSNYQLLTRSLKYMTTNITQELEEALWAESRMPLSVQEWAWIRFLWLIPALAFLSWWESLLLQGKTS